MSLNLVKPFTNELSLDIYNRDMTSLFNAFSGLESQKATLGGLTIQPLANGDIFELKDAAGTRHVYFDSATGILHGTGRDKTIWLGTPVLKLNTSASNSAATWTDLDCSAQTSSNTAFLILNLWCRHTAAGQSLSVRPNGGSQAWNFSPHITTQVASIYMVAGSVVVECDTSQVIEWYATAANMTNLGIMLMGYIEQD